MALTGVLVAGALSLLLARWAGLGAGYGLGLFAGSGTSTPTLQAAIAAVGNDDPAVGYSVAYPFGVAGPILFLYLTFLWRKPRIDAPAGLRAGIARGRPATARVRRPAARRVDGRPARRGAGRGRPARRPQPAGRSRPGPRAGTTCCWPSPRHRGRARPVASDCRRGGARPAHRGPPGPRLPARVRVAAGRAGPGARRTGPAGRPAGGHRPGPPRGRRTSCRPRTSCSSSATASACSPIERTSRPCGRTSATRSRARPS